MLAAAVAFAAVPGQNLVFAQEVPYETTVAQEEENYGTEQDSGSVGDITWTFYDSGTLVIDGSGSTPDYWPWFNYKEDVKKVVVKENVTALGERAFMNHVNLKSVEIQGELTQVSDSAFENCTALKQITFTKKVGSVGTQAFYKDTALVSVTFDGDVVLCSILRSRKQ